ISFGLLPVIIRLAHRYKWYDLPDNQRKIHTGLIPRMGGTSIFIAFFSSLFLAPLLSSLISESRISLLSSTRFVPVFAGALLAYLVGLYDDFRNLRALLKFFLQLLAAAIVAGGGFLISSFSLPYMGTIHLGLLAYPVTIFWIVGIANAVNLIDGMDGLASGIAAIASLSMGVIAIIQGVPQTAILALALFGALVGFLAHNFPPAKIFMGDSGSLFVGFVLAVLPLMGISKASAFGTLIVPVTLLTVPILDTAT
ncbi:unnamed protein product, partial [marine sediment metagenome]